MHTNIKSRICTQKITRDWLVPQNAKALGQEDHGGEADSPFAGRIDYCDC